MSSGLLRSVRGPFLTIPVQGGSWPPLGRGAAVIGARKAQQVSGRAAGTAPRPRARRGARWLTALALAAPIAATGSLTSVSSVSSVHAGAAGTTTPALGTMSDRFSASNHTCLVVDDGRLVCWGAGLYGQLGYGNTSSRSDATVAANPVNGGFVPLPAGRTVAAVSTGNAHTCALLDNGQVACWGLGSQGVLGYGNTNGIGDNETPAQNPVNGGIVPLPGGHTAVAVEAYFSHSCALLDNGQVTCWGAGTLGQLGYGNTNNIGDDETPAQNPVNGGMVPLPAGRTAVALASGSAFTCVLLDNGQVACWGAASVGRLGYGNTNNIGDNETPAQNPVNGGMVPLPLGRTAAALGGGDAHMCAVLDNGSVTCWGNGAFGQLGYGNPNDIGDNETPAQNPVDGGFVRLPVSRTAVGIAGSFRHTCALLDDGSMSCWGEGTGGKLGYGNTVTIGDDEKPDTNPVNGGVVPLAPGRRVLALAVGRDYTCVLLSDTRLVCLGQTNSLAINERVGDDEPASAARAIRLPMQRRVVQAAVGASASCVLLDNGIVNCWGSNSFAQLAGFETSPVGDNETAHITGGVQLPGERTATQIAMGNSHACAVLDNAGVTCWGVGTNGKLGYGNVNDIGDNESPAANPVNGGLVSLPSGRSAVSVTVGDQHTCALLDNSQITCWGDAADGQLGYGNTNDIGDNEQPSGNPVNGGIVPLPAGRTARAVTAGAGFTCALLDNWQVACWGSNIFGEIGYGNTNNIGDNETPATNPVNGGVVPLPAGHTATAVVAGRFHTCAVLDNAQLSCWGDGFAGKLGYGNQNTIGNSLTPATNPVNGGLVPLPAERSVLSVGAGQDHTCAVLDNGTVSCWGDGADGRLGYGSLTDIGDNETPADNPVNFGFVSLPGGRAAVSVQLGILHTCALLDDGTVACWGNSGSAGRLGYGNTLIIGDNEFPSNNSVNGGIVPIAQPVTRVDYRAVQPARLLDTRVGGSTIDGQFEAGGVRPAGSTLALKVVGRGGAPVGSTAVTLTVAVVSPAADGFLTVWPCAKPMPTASSLNFSAGASTANTVITATGGDVCIFTSKATHLIADLTGFTPPTTRYSAFNPARLLDTRPNHATFDGLAAGAGTRPAGSSTTLQVTGRGVPAVVAAGTRTVVLNVAAVTPAAGGYLTIWPCDQPQPNASNVNFAAGRTTANMVIARVSGAGTVCVYTSQGTDLIADVVGSFDQLRALNPSTVRSINPARLVDTRPSGVTTDGSFQRTGALAANTTYAFGIANRFPLTNASTAVLNIAVVNPAGNGFLTTWPCDRPAPTASSLNYLAGVNRANQVVSALSATGTICVRSSQAVQLIIDVSGSTM